MPNRSNVVYVYDGSFEGLLCCIFESFASKEFPVMIFNESEANPSLFSQKKIETDLVKFQRVKKGIITKISIDAYELITDVYFSCHPKKEVLICDFARMGFQIGRKVTKYLSDKCVSAMQKAARQLHNEAHLFKGFVRFLDHRGVLTAIIEPKNFVLPLIAPHFTNRYSGETFMIYDKSHAFALIHRPGEWKILPIQQFTEPPAEEGEQKIRSLWKLFYDTMAIKERENPTCRRNHMPKRFWSHMTEMEEQKTPQGLPPKQEN